MTTPKISRRKFLAAAGMGGAALTGYAACREAEWLDVGRHEVKTGVEGEPVKVLHLADLHASWCVSLSYIEQAIECGLQLKPDLICVTGDFITRRFDDFDKYGRILSRLAAAAPAYACLGNHDGGYWAGRRGGYETTDQVCNLLQKSRVELLHNHSTDLQLKGRQIRLVGLGDPFAHELYPDQAFPRHATTRPPYSIVLSHNPDSKEVLAHYPWDLMLCGHTHGGQICLPLIGPPYLPLKDRRFYAGLYCWQNRWMHITKGVGNILGVRLNCRPEVSLLTLV